MELSRLALQATATPPAGGPPGSPPAPRRQVAGEALTLTRLERPAAQASQSRVPAILSGVFEPVPPLDQSIARMRRLEAELVAKGDMRAVFVTTYLEILHATQEAVAKPGFFEDPATVELEARYFVQLYLSAHDAYDRGDMARVPAPWRASFDLAASGRSLAIENLLLGINAHVNYDLPRALAAAGANSPANERDFERFNDLLFERIDPIKRRVIDRYTQPAPVGNRRALHLLDRVAGQLDEKATKLMFVQWRNRAWEHSAALAEGRADAIRQIDTAAMQGVHAVHAMGRLTPFKGYLLDRKLF